MKSAWVPLNRLFWNPISKKISVGKNTVAFTTPCDVFPANCQYFVLALKPCPKSVVNSTASPSLVPQLPCVTSSGSGFRILCLESAAEGDIELGASAWTTVQTPLSCSPAFIRFIPGSRSFHVKITRKGKFERWCPFSFFRSVCPTAVSFSHQCRGFCFGISSRRREKACTAWFPD